MCGLGGLFSYDGDLPHEIEGELQRISNRMASRGPDGSSSWSSRDKRVHLSHRRLAVIDTSDRATQPMLDVAGRYLISFNGEIYNHRTLRAELLARGYRFRTGSDTETILNLFAAEGPSACSKLQGMYAFAIYDTAERSLFLARDPYGIKPLYVSDDGRVLRFASQVKALLAGGRTDPAIDPAGLAGFALFGHVPEPFTLYKAIRAVPAGHHMIVRDGQVGEPVPIAAIAGEFARPQLQTANDIRALCRAALRESVARHLEADVPVGLFLSGGVDSGALLGLMRDGLGTQPIQAITLAFDDLSGSSWDEEPSARAVAAHYGARHHVHRVSRATLAESLPVILEAMDQPTVDGVNTWFVAGAARKLGLKVALSGIGGDELLGGYSTFRTVPATVRATALPGSVPGLGKLARQLGTAALPGLHRRNPKALAAFELGGSYPGAYLLRRGLFMPHELPNVLGVELAREGLRQLDPIGLVARSLQPASPHALLRVAALESDQYLRNQLLRDADWAGMAHGVEIRTPFVDFHLLETLAPHLARLMAGDGKALLASAPSKPLPDAVLNRPKSGFSVPMASLLAGQKASNNRLTSRAWVRHVLAAFAGQDRALAA